MSASNDTRLHIVAVDTRRGFFSIVLSNSAAQRTRIRARHLMVAPELLARLSVQDRLGVAVLAIGDVA